MQPLDRDSNTHARAQVLAGFSRARRIGKKKKKGRTDRTNREQIAKTTNFHWPDRQRQINAKSECTDFFWGGGEMEKSFCTVAGMSWLSSSAVHAAGKRRAAASTSPKSNTASGNRCEQKMNSPLSPSVLLSRVVWWSHHFTFHWDKTTHTVFIIPLTTAARTQI